MPALAPTLQVADLIDDEQLSATEIADAFAQPSLAVGAGEAVDDVGKRGEVDAAAGTDGFDAECHGQVAFAGAGLADEVDHLVAIDEVELGECQDTIAVERGLEGEVEARQRLDDTQPGHLQCRLDAAGLTDGEFLGQQHLDRLDGAELTAFDLLDQMVERLESARHAQTDQVAADPFDRGIRRELARHGPAPAPARRRATAS